eukprot:CAMPEP_0201555740 /NCGR_PEP_ID=MMETSP0173_2-20130828/51011_1 /ASSEMBLY_ACC=CAM_ASM_000268 /TAXON_ID=218659 /ORGANISM="Vexillifera sp., Strain DIVA3 564/2" /LENGTH=352 /DNA_ID=CAMNT_0047967685 /DNA_START=253 /DNA_END=1308 /DNA_ORIENTATION=+
MLIELLEGHCRLSRREFRSAPERVQRDALHLYTNSFDTGRIQTLTPSMVTVCIHKLATAVESTAGGYSDLHIVRRFEAFECLLYRALVISYSGDRTSHFSSDQVVSLIEDCVTTLIQLTEIFESEHENDYDTSASSSSPLPMLHQESLIDESKERHQAYLLAHHPLAIIDPRTLTFLTRLCQMLIARLLQITWETPNLPSDALATLFYCVCSRPNFFINASRQPLGAYFTNNSKLTAVLGKLGIADVVFSDDTKDWVIAGDAQLELYVGTLVDLVEAHHNHMTPTDISKILYTVMRIRQGRGIRFIDPHHEKYKQSLDSIVDKLFSRLVNLLIGLERYLLLHPEDDTNNLLK